MNYALDFNDLDGLRKEGFKGLGQVVSSKVKIQTFLFLSLKTTGLTVQGSFILARPQI
jgi:hypothetical protein